MRVREKQLGKRTRRPWKFTLSRLVATCSTMAWGLPAGGHPSCCAGCLGAKLGVELQDRKFEETET